MASVGGGGLICGLLEGLERHGWRETTLITAETEGASCLGFGFGFGFGFEF